MVAGECSIIAGVIVTCILAVLSGLCLVLALVFFVYARRKLEQVAFIERSPHGKKLKRQSHGAGIINGAYLADDLNMQEAGSSDQLDGGTMSFGGKIGIPGYVVCKEFMPTGHDKWLKGSVQDKMVYRLMAGDVNFEVRENENGGESAKSSFYLAFAGVKESSPNGALLSGASKLLKSGDRIHALMLNCTALASSGQFDETTAQLLLKLVRLVEEQPAIAFVDVVSSAPHERLVDGGETSVCVVNKEEELAATNSGTAEMRKAELSTSESKDSGREETQTNSEHGEHDEASSGAISGDDAVTTSPQKGKPGGGGSFVARSRGHSRRSQTSSNDQAFFQSTESSESQLQKPGQDVAIPVDDVVVSVVNSCLPIDFPLRNTTVQQQENADDEAIELTTQHPAYFPINGNRGEGYDVASSSLVEQPQQSQTSLPLPAPDLLQSPGDDVVVLATSSSSSSSSSSPLSSSSNSDDEKITEPTSPRNSSCILNGTTRDISPSTKLDAYMAL